MNTVFSANRPDVFAESGLVSLLYFRLPSGEHAVKKAFTRGMKHIQFC